jgi:DHA2 family metal-tetracycline-proton antiporter-like MFS transporter
VEDGKRQRWLLAIASVTAFVTCLDSTMLSTALPTISKDVEIGVDAIAYLPAINLLVFASFVLTFGKLGDIKGYRRLFITGLALFTIGSMCCGLSFNLWMLVLARFVQSVGAAMIGPTITAIIISFVPSDATGKALGFLAIPTGLGLSLGPALGGVFSSYLTWRLIFFVNIQACMLLLFAVSRYMPLQQPKPRDDSFDILGAVILFFALTPLLYALNAGPEDGWTNGAVIAGFMLFVIAFILFILRQRAISYPILELDLFKNRNFSFSIASEFLASGAFVAIIYLLPFYLQYVRGMQAYQVGFYLMIPPLAMIVTGPLAGRLSDKKGSRRMCAVGALMTAVTYALLSLLYHSDHIGFVVLPLILLGAGMGFFEAPNDKRILANTPPWKKGMAAGAQKTLSNTGRAVNIVLFTLVLQWVVVPLAALEGVSLEQVESYPAIMVEGFQSAFIFGIFISVLALITTLLARNE